jgi:hypothetical protein
MSDHKSPKCSLCNKAGHNKRSCKEILEKAAKKTHKKVKNVIEEIKEVIEEVMEVKEDVKEAPKVPKVPKDDEERLAIVKENIMYFMESKQLINALDNFCKITDPLKAQEELIGFIDKRIAELHMEMNG